MQVTFCLVSNLACIFIFASFHNAKKIVFIPILSHCLNAYRDRASFKCLHLLHRDYMEFYFAVQCLIN